MTAHRKRITRKSKTSVKRRRNRRRTSRCKISRGRKVSKGGRRSRVSKRRRRKTKSSHKTRKTKSSRKHRRKTKQHKGGFPPLIAALGVAAVAAPAMHGIRCSVAPNSVGCKKDTQPPNTA